MESTGEEKETPIVPYIGHTFVTLDQAKTFYNQYAQEKGFDVRSRSTQKRIKHDNRVSSCLLVCAREDFHTKTVPKKTDDPNKHVITRNCSTQKCGCKAMLRLCLLKDGRWRVTRFQEEHNHKSVTPSKRMCMKGNKHMPKAAKDLVDAFREENLPVSKVAAILDGKVVGFDERDCYNHLGASKKHKTPIDGDATAMLNFFKKKQIEDPHFFYAIQPDSDSRAVIFFWWMGGLGCNINTLVMCYISIRRTRRICINCLMLLSLG
ncbi:hypothetical protein ACHQM5_021076 [Ranunculus cassubicifolius]